MVFLTYVAVRHALDTDYMSLFYWLNFGIHEVGHVITRPFLPHFLYVAAGTIAELGVPIFAIFMFRRQDDLFAAYPVSGVWLATNLYYCGWYVADARTQKNPTAPIFGEPTTSDWTYMLGELGILTWDKPLSWLFYGSGFLVMWASISVGVYMLWQMIRLPSDRPVR